MKLLTFESRHGAERVGALLGDGARIVDLAAAHLRMAGSEAPELQSMQALIEGGDPSLDLARKLLGQAESMDESEAVTALDRVRLLAPLPRPVRMRCFSVYEKHMRQSLDAVVRARGGAVAVALNRLLGIVSIPKQFYRSPAYYKGNHTSVVGPEAEILWPSFPETKLDYELELGLVVGRAGQDIAECDAHAHIFGYTIYNDVSARDRLLAELMGGKLGPLKGKDFEGGNIIGPWIVTADEIPDPGSLRMEVRVNGALRGVGHTSEMHHSIGAMIAEASLGERVLPGELIGTGAVGDGTGIERWAFLDPGDVVELEIERIGVLRNRVSPRA